MRTLFVFFAVIFFHSSFAASLAPQFSQARYSPSFGLMLTDFNVSGGGVSYQTTPEVGYSIGLDVYIPSESNYVDYLTGLYYWSSRTRFESSYQVGAVDVYQNSLVEVNRLSLPIMAKIYPFENLNWFYTKVGVFNHFLLSVSEQTTLVTSNGGSVETQNFFTDENRYETFFLDGILGLGIEPRLSRNFGFFIELNYLHGLTPIIKGDSTRTSTFFTSFGIGF